MKRTNEIIAENVSRLRESKGLSQTELAHNAKVSLHTVFRIEHGNENVRPASIRAVAGALGTTIESLERPLQVGARDAKSSDRVEIQLKIALAEIERLKSLPHVVAIDGIGNLTEREWNLIKAHRQNPRALQLVTEMLATGDARLFEEAASLGLGSDELQALRAIYR